ncbi:leukemia inhibitory factor receptor isoform X2 [Trachinotus anak]|uniref:leukemia inhibitory factor receptor isoform X2 n=1 Tax=Trachinotus anak TaxID=443729 RepID=UPI0039F1DA2F
MMAHLRMSLINLLGLHLIFFEDHCCLDTVWQLPRPSISHLKADVGKQSLVVSWLVNHSGLVGDINEIQISRTENHTIIYSKNISAPSGDSQEYTWTWTSDLPLNCVDHSVRIRYFYNQSVPSPWSEWVTNYGVQAKDKTEMFPFERVLREGTNVTFCCVPPRGVNITGIAFKNTKYPLISVGARVKAITVTNLTIPTIIFKVLLFSCYDTTNKINSVWNYVSFPPQKPRNLSCATSHMTTVTCTWDPGRYRDPNDRNKQTRTLHILNSDQAPINCKPSSCTFAAIPQLEQYNISLVVKDQLGEEAESYSFNISDRVVPVVEWDRLSPGVTDTTVSWVIQGNLTHLNPLCQVTVAPGSTTELNCSGVSSLCKVKLEHLLPNTLHSARVRCSVNGRLWGKWTQALPFKTCPFMTLNLWRRIGQISDPHSRQVTLLWMLSAPGSATTEIIQGYTVQWSQDGQNRTQEKDSAQTQAEVSIGPGQYDFTVTAVRHTCPSITAHITIPKLDDREILLVERRLSSSAAGGFDLNWPLQEAATCGYTVEWCSRGNAVTCTLKWIKMEEGNNTLFLPARNFKAGRRYTFNIYGCTENGQRLLEVQTGYSQELKVQSPSQVEPVQSTPSSVTLEWRYNENDPAHPAFITGYLVTVQEVGANMLPGHIANAFNVSVADPWRKSVTIEDLKQCHEYAFSVSALTKVGPGQPTGIIRTTTKCSVHLAKILIPVLLLLGCAFLLWPQRKMLKKGLREIFVYPAGMTIKTFEIASFLHEAGERVQSQKVEECVSCDIEILNSRSDLNEATTLRDPEPPSRPPSPGSQSSRSSSSASCVQPQGYCPQSATLLWEGPAFQQITCILNKNYFQPMVEDFFEPQDVTLSDINSSFDPSECLQESSCVIYGYVSTD